MHTLILGLFKGVEESSRVLYCALWTQHAGSGSKTVYRIGFNKSNRGNIYRWAGSETILDGAKLHGFQTGKPKDIVVGEAAVDVAQINCWANELAGQTVIQPCEFVIQLLRKLERTDSYRSSVKRRWSRVVQDWWDDQDLGVFLPGPKTQSPKQYGQPSRIGYDTLHDRVEKDPLTDGIVEIKDKPIRYDPNVPIGTDPVNDGCSTGTSSKSPRSSNLSPLQSSNPTSTGSKAINSPGGPSNSVSSTTDSPLKTPGTGSAKIRPRPILNIRKAQAYDAMASRSVPTSPLSQVHFPTNNLDAIVNEPLHPLLSEQPTVASFPSFPLSPPRSPVSTNGFPYAPQQVPRLRSDRAATFSVNHQSQPPHSGQPQPVSQVDHRRAVHFASSSPAGPSSPSLAQARLGNRPRGATTGPNLPLHKSPPPSTTASPSSHMRSRSRTSSTGLGHSLIANEDTTPRKDHEKQQRRKYYYDNDIERRKACSGEAGGRKRAATASGSGSSGATGSNGKHSKAKDKEISFLDWLW